jgi:glycosyltransferase involved in cell wall biosynthesis
MMVAPALRNVLLQNPSVKLVLVNSALEKSCNALGRPYPFAGMRNVTTADRSVAINRYAPFMASFGFDVGIAPLVDHNFNRSKSNLRWLEYSALGIPSVCTNISHFKETIKDGQDGMLADGLEQWEHALNSLISFKNMRGNMGRMANKRVKEDFNVKRNAPEYVRLLKKISNFSTISEEDTWTGQACTSLLVA